MIARLLEFSDEGEILRRDKVEYYYASSERIPTICIKLSGKVKGRTKGNHIEVQLPKKALLHFIKKRDSVEVKK